MKETTNNWQFTELSEPGEVLDIDAIFGAPAASEPTPFPAPPFESAPQTAQPTEPTLMQQTEEAPQTAEPVTQPAGGGLFEQPPVFVYGSVREDIEDATQTFDQLRIAKAADFPELDDAKSVSWSVTYGKTTKPIKAPTSMAIRSVKEEIERSKPFLTDLKKAADKNLRCLVKPSVTVQKKGIPAYKGVFQSLDDARASDKVICLIPAADGRIYELRKTELGDFIAPKHNITEFSKCKAGFIPALPRIPLALLQQIVAFFRDFMDENGSYEALVHILWDRVQHRYVVRVPRQTR